MADRKEMLFATQETGLAPRHATLAASEAGIEGEVRSQWHRHWAADGRLKHRLQTETGRWTLIHGDWMWIIPPQRVKASQLDSSIVWLDTSARDEQGRHLLLDTRDDGSRRHGLRERFVRAPLRGPVVGEKYLSAVSSQRRVLACHSVGVVLGGEPWHLHDAPVVMAPRSRRPAEREPASTPRRRF